MWKWCISTRDTSFQWLESSEKQYSSQASYWAAEDAKNSLSHDGSHEATTPQMISLMCCLLVKPYLYGRNTEDNTIRQPSERRNNPHSGSWLHQRNVAFFGGLCSAAVGFHSQYPHGQTCTSAHPKTLAWGSSPIDFTPPANYLYIFTLLLTQALSAATAGNWFWGVPVRGPELIVGPRAAPLPERYWCPLRQWSARASEEALRRAQNLFTLALRVPFCQTGMKKKKIYM